ncbi:Peptidoglycan/LPS O-acetylase OafA/YrhL, contains acyltransferase and SGNH-hydrolase domains [Streptosporangium subroseum]|uniref:Peptidoglycan/LPS O-acetylase OafA/YrhL, contains acyltransferase and SGNH-hydrolase domains n=1 Tax=Streptosporangium subroseum TaxID=106412 RepID=A0A239AT34_9ACTN|nr:Peptidoglycan/LPS O-acetylase OafA/YrhL, contains acyltransferase and SGNH-hydrolase domains [Streptosporangium subroseum]
MTGTGPREVVRESGRLAELDLLRFVAALAVVSFHYFIAFASVWGDRPAELFPAISTLSGLGILGVELFFMISGFVILMSIWGRGIGAFALSRLVRLFPAYWVSVAATAAVYGLTAATALDPKLSLGEYGINLTMLQRAFGVYDANGVYWSLWAELRFYLLISVLVLVGVTFNRCLIFMGVWLLAAGIFSNSDAAWVDLVVMPKYAAYFVGGMAFFLMTRYGPKLILWCFAGVSGGLAVNAAMERVAGRIELVGYAAMPVPGWAVAVVVIGFYVLMAAVALGGLRRIRWRGLTVLGALTYPLYLFHPTAAVLIIPLLRDTLPPWLTAVVTVGAAMAFSYLVYRVAERPIQEFVKARRRGRSPLPPVSPPAPPTGMPFMTGEKASVP